MKIRDNIPIFIISSVERREYIIKLLSDNKITNATLINSVRGDLNTLQNKLVAFNGKTFYVPRGNTDTPKALGQLSCFLTHVEALQTAGNTPCLILEDDIKFNIDLETEIEIPHEAELVYLSSFLSNNKEIVNRKVGLNQPSKKDRIWTTTAYYVKDPKKLLDILKLYRPKAIDSYYNCFACKKLNTYYYYPNIISQNTDLESLIDNKNKYLSKLK
jgi:GR25 family glycosyltransferase involved in LPS biosynthesis